ncbi:GGDEF domain-containing protein, partial [Micromonospora sp. NPDC004540]
MPVTPSAGSRRRPPLPDLIVSLAGALFVLAGAAGLVPGPAAVALAVAGGSALACVRLAWLAGAPPAPPDPSAAPPAQPRSGTAPDRAEPAAARPTGRRARRVALSRRVAGILDAAVLAAGLTVAVLPLCEPGHRLPVALAGLAITAPLYAVALLRLPGRSRLAGRERLRRGVDVVGLGVSLVFAGGVLLPSGPVPPAARAATIGGAVALAVLLVAAFAERRRRPGAARCHAGAAVTLGGLALLVVLLAYAAPDRAVLVVAPPLLAGALVTAAGARRTAAG